MLGNNFHREGWTQVVQVKKETVSVTETVTVEKPVVNLTLTEQQARTLNVLAYVTQVNGKELPFILTQDERTFAEELRFSLMSAGVQG